jgi:DNA (cytosine-5)-methyltransferase 1
MEAQQQKRSRTKTAISRSKNAADLAATNLASDSGDLPCRPPLPPPAFTFAEFFAGIGLVRLALEQAGGRVLLANDIDPDKAVLYRQNFAADELLVGDIHQLEPEQLPPCDVWTASFPCTDLSIAGAMKGLAGEHSGAFWGVMRLLEKVSQKPRVVLLENVPGFLVANGGEDFRAAMLALNEVGYACDVFSIDAAWFRPQSRQRLFVVAQRDAESQPLFGLQASALRPEKLVAAMHRNADLDWCVRPLPTIVDQQPKLGDVLEDLPTGHEAWWSEERVVYFMNQLSPRHLATAETMIAGKAVSSATAFRRIRGGRSMAELRTDGLAGCLRTPKGGSARQILFQAGNGERRVRLLTARECARLQGVPDWYRIDVPLNQALFGFGDAVCVPVLEWIARNYLLPVLGR